jgi:dienelactone hydrolase
LTGGTGVKSANNQLQADKYASEGFLVIMPDQYVSVQRLITAYLLKCFRFDGDAAPNTAIEPKPASEPSILERLKLGLADGAKSFMIDMWLARHTREKVLPLLHKVIDAAKEEFADAVANGGGIYGVGYCFGAKYILLLGGQHAEEQGSEKKGPFIKAGAVAHGAQVVPDDIAAVTVPMSLVCVEDDPLFPEEIRKTGEDALVKSGVEHEMKIYPGVPHGKNLTSTVSLPLLTELSRLRCPRRLC